VKILIQRLLVEKAALKVVQNPLTFGTKKLQVPNVNFPVKDIKHLLFR
jgi:hypothetical protein